MRHIKHNIITGVDPGINKRKKIKNSQIIILNNFTFTNQNSRGMQVALSVFVCLSVYVCVCVCVSV